MTGHAFSFGGVPLRALPSGALLAPDTRTLLVSDLHFGRAQRGALHGGAPLPPYEAAETLDRLEAEIARHAPAHVIALGDSFDDAGAPARLDPAAAARLHALCAARAWTWIAGNHDPAPHGLPGRTCAETRLGPLILRHIADPVETGPELSGHWHPKARLGRGPARRCFLRTGTRLILPAFGAYTGGLDISAAPLRALAPEGEALLCRPDTPETPGAVLAVPLPGLRAGRPGRERSSGGRSSAR